MIKGVIFDLDGVLVFTDKYHYQAWKKMADDEGIYFDEEINNRLRGVSRMDSLNIILEKATKNYSQEEKERLATKKNEIYKSLLKELTPESVSKEVRDTLEYLKSKGIKLAIGSSSKNTNLILKNTDLAKYFDKVADGNQITHSKPNPEVFLLAGRLLNLDPSECMVIEDAYAGIDAASDGGFTSCGIGEASKYSKATYKISSLHEIINIVLPEEKNSTKIQLKHIKKVYPNGVCAVKDFSLDISDEEFVVFVGPSGCGKSTVLRMIAGLEEITSGELLIDGEVMNDEEPIDRDIAMVFQNYALYPHLTVRQNIAFPLSIKKYTFKQFFDFKYRKNRAKQINDIVENVAAKIGLTEYLERKPKNLSGGQRQRVALGRAIVRNPKAFLLDEPLSNLDAKMRAQMRTEISKLHKDLKTIFIYVTHDQVEAMTMGTKIVVMRDGIIQQIANPTELFRNPVNKFVAGFIGTPQMNFIDAKLSKKGKEVYVTFGADNITLPLPEQIKKKVPSSYIDKQVIMGIRPKAIYIDEKKEQGIKAKISLSEQLGDEALIYCTLDGKKEDLVCSIQTDAQFKNDDEINLGFNLDHLCLFSKDDEMSIYEK